MENLSLSFASRRNPANTNSSPVGEGVTGGQTALEFCKGKTNIVFRGVSSDCQNIMGAGETREAVIKSFVLKPVWDYSTTPATKTNEVKLNALVVCEGSIFTVSLFQHQTALRVGQTVSVRASSEYFTANNRTMLSAEILD